MLISNLLIAQSLVRQFEDGDYLLEISQWTKEDGLPSWHIYDFIEDKRGYIWMGSAVGLIRFDGRNFVTFSGESQGLPNGHIGRIAEDVNEKIWLLFNNGENKKAISIFDPLNEKAIPVESYIHQSISLSPLSHHGFFKQQDTIWILDPITGKGGCYSGEWEEVLNDTTVTRPDFINFKSYYPRKDELFWVWDQEEDYSAIRLINQSGQVIPYTSFQRKGENFSLIDQDLNFYYWQQSIDAFSLDTIFRFDEDGIKAFPFGEYPKVLWGNTTLQDYYKFLKTNQHNIGLSVDMHSVFFFDNEEILFKNLATLLATEFKVKINEAVFLDKKGAFWFAAPAGFFRMRIKKKVFTTYTPKDNKPLSVRGMLSIGDSQLIANTYSGTFKINLDNQSFSLLPIKDHSVNSCLLKEGNTLWIGRYFDDLIQYDLQTQQYQQFPLNYYREDYSGYAFCRLNDSILWMASDCGILQLNDHTQLFDDYILQDTAVYCWHINQQGIWAGSKTGLLKFNKKGQIEKSFPIVENNKKKVGIYYIHEDKNGIFWMASSQGLLRWNPNTEEYRQYTTIDGLSDIAIHAIYEDSYGNLWLPSNYGLMCFRKADAHVTTYLEKDGLPSNEFNYLAHYQREDGLLFLGGVNGIISFYPDSLSVFRSPVVLLEFGSIKIYDRETELAVNRMSEAVNLGEIVICANENRMEIELVPHFLLDQEMVYEWRIPSEGKKWRTMRAHFLELNNPAYGDYLLEFRAYPLGDRQSQSKTLSVQLKVLKPFYLSGWFISLAGLLGALLVHQYILRRQRQLMAQKLELEMKVNNQTRELKSKLITINKQARELKMLDQLKSRFFINISHELRTPITLILGPVTNLIEQPLTKYQQAQLYRIKRNARQLQQLTEEILDLARLEAGKLKINEEPAHLSNFVKRIFAAYISLANYREISYEIELSVLDDLRLYMDVTKVERILNNFIDNALKFTWAGGTVLLKVRTTDKEVCFSVQDTGVGIPPDDMPRIFDRYYQARHQSGLENGGLGIGLAMSKELAELMNGQVWASSILNKGTTLFFNLPLKQQTKWADEKTPPLEVKINKPKEIPTVISPKLKPIRAKEQPCLLLVEDNEDLLNYLSEILHTRFRIITAKNGIEALVILENSKIDLIVSDVMMPKMTGFELLKYVRSQPQKWGLPFILLTARSEQEDQLYSLRLGVDAYLSKPFEQKELLARIHNLLENQRKRKKAFISGPFAENYFKENVDDSKNFNFDDLWLTELESYLRKKIKHSNLKVADLAMDMAMSERSFRTKLKVCTGLKPNQYILEARLERAYQLLIDKQYSTIAEIVYSVGIQSKAYFSKVFKKKYGKSPSELLK